MATSIEYHDYVLSFFSLPNISSKKMFGEYGLFYQGKMFGTIENNLVYIKITVTSEQWLNHLPKQSPHAGARPSFLVENLNEVAWDALVEAMIGDIPEPKPRKKTNKNAARVK